MCASRTILPFIVSWPPANFRPYCFSSFVKSAMPSMPSGTLMTVNPSTGCDANSSSPMAWTPARAEAADRVHDEHGRRLRHQLAERLDVAADAGGGLAERRGDGGRVRVLGQRLGQLLRGHGLAVGDAEGHHLDAERLAQAAPAVAE